MLKSAIYCNVFILLIMSIFFMTKIFKKNSDLKNIRKLIIIYIIFNFISFYLCNSEIVDTGWDLIFLLPISIISFVIHIVSICCINKKIKKLDNTDCNSFSIKKYIILTFITIVFQLLYLYHRQFVKNQFYSQLHDTPFHKYYRVTKIGNKSKIITSDNRSFEI